MTTTTKLTNRQQQERHYRSVLRRAKKIVRDATDGDMTVDEMWSSGYTLAVDVVPAARMNDLADPMRRPESLRVKLVKGADAAEALRPAIDACRELMDAQENHVDADDLPLGVYGVIYYRAGADGGVVQEAGCDASVSEGCVQRLIATKMADHEAAVAQCQSQRGGCVIAGSRAMLDRMLGHPDA